MWPLLGQDGQGLDAVGHEGHRRQRKPDALLHQEEGRLRNEVNQRLQTGRPVPEQNLEESGDQGHVLQRLLLQVRGSRGGLSD